MVSANRRNTRWQRANTRKPRCLKANTREFSWQGEKKVNAENRVPRLRMLTVSQHRRWS